MKRIVSLILSLLLISVLLVGCSGKEKKIVHCDNCGVEISVDVDSKVDDDWILYCPECEEALGLDKLFD